MLSHARASPSWWLIIHNHPAPSSCETIRNHMSQDFNHHRLQWSSTFWYIRIYIYTFIPIKQLRKASQMMLSMFFFIFFFDPFLFPAPQKIQQKIDWNTSLSGWWCSSTQAAVQRRNCEFSLGKWGASLNGGFPPISHPKIIIFSRKTHGCWVPRTTHFRKPPNEQICFRGCGWAPFFAPFNRVSNVYVKTGNSKHAKSKLSTIEPYSNSQWNVCISIFPHWTYGWF